MYIYINQTYHNELATIYGHLVCYQLSANPYSPRKQGAGLASLSNVVNTKAYLTVKDIDRTKLELGDDKEKLGVYSMTFSVVNLSEDTLSYDLSLIAMTETVSKSDSDYVAEKAQILGGKTVFSVGGTVINGSIFPFFRC